MLWRNITVTNTVADDYGDITTLLQALESHFRQKTVLIAGSAHEYGITEPATAETFMRDLSRALIRSGYKIVSGFGVGVGSHVITGALQHVYEQQGQKLHDQLILRPFPQGSEAQKQWETYQQDMIVHAGTAIFVFGNTLENGAVVSAEGVAREFEIAKDLGLKLIPIGATGYMAEKPWKEVMANFDSYCPNSHPALKNAFESLNDTGNDLTKHITTVMYILGILQRG